MKRRRVVLGLVLLLIMSHIVQVFFTGWTRESIWIFVVDVLILLLIFLREYVVDGFVWLRSKRQNSIDNKVLAFLISGRATGSAKTVDEICAAVGVKQKTVMASLHRLSDTLRVDTNAQGRWWKVLR